MMLKNVSPHPQRKKNNNKSKFSNRHSIKSSHNSFFFISTGSSSSDVLTSKDISASQSDITSIIHQTNQSNFIN